MAKRSSRGARSRARVLRNARPAATKTMRERLWLGVLWLFELVLKIAPRLLYELVKLMLDM